MVSNNSSSGLAANKQDNPIPEPERDAADHTLVHSLIADPSIRDLIKKKCRRICRRPGFANDEWEDIEHDLLICVFENCGKYDPTRGTPAAFVSTLLKNKAASIVRHADAQRRDPRREGPSLDAPVGRDDDGQTVPLHLTIQAGESESARDLHEHIAARLNNLPDQERLEALRYLQRLQTNGGRAPGMRLSDWTVTLLRRELRDCEFC